MRVRKSATSGEPTLPKFAVQEAQVTKTLDPYRMTSIMNELHTLHAHMLYYNSLLAEFQKAVTFVKDTANPAIKDDENEQQARDAMEVECEHILQGINRIEKQCQAQIMRLSNARNLVRFSTPNLASPLIAALQGESHLNIHDSKQSTKLTQASLRDSAGSRNSFRLSYVLINTRSNESDYVFDAGVPACDIHGSKCTAS